jgi:ribosome-associated protein
MRRVTITGEFITLGQLLQFAGLVETGGEAKRVLAAAQVSMNGVPELRRGRKLRHGDLIAVTGHEPILVVTH